MDTKENIEACLQHIARGETAKALRIHSRLTRKDRDEVILILLKDRCLTFRADAERLSASLAITLGTAGDEQATPCVSFPRAALGDHLQRLAAQAVRLALCDVVSSTIRHVA